MKNENNSNYTAKKVVMFFLYILTGGFTTVLTIYHFFDSLRSSLMNEIIYSLIIGLVIAAAYTYRRIHSGKMAEPIVNMKKYKYWAFTELAVFYFFMLLGVIHIFDHDGAYMVEEMLLAVFFGLFCGGVSVLHLIKKDKCKNDR